MITKDINILKRVANLPCKYLRENIAAPKDCVKQIKRKKGKYEQKRSDHNSNPNPNPNPTPFPSFSLFSHPQHNRQLLRNARHAVTFIIISHWTQIT